MNRQSLIGNLSVVLALAVLFLSGCATAPGPLPPLVVLDGGPPLPPGAFRGLVDTNDYQFPLRVGWTPAPTAGATNYTIGYGPAAGVYTNLTDYSTNLTALIWLADIRASYHFAVRAQYPVGTTAWSRELVWPLAITNHFPVGVTLQAAGNLNGPYTNVVHFTVLVRTNVTDRLFYRTLVDIAQTNANGAFTLDGSTLGATNQ